MPRTHCLDCGTSVVVDPRGVCPEGHHVGAAGARVAAVLADDRPHPDEPEPWTARVELDEEPTEADAAPARRARPVAVEEPAAATEDVAAPVGDELLRELHSLGGTESSPGAEASPTDLAAAPSVAPSQVLPAPAPTSALDFDALAELTALEAAVHSLDVGHEVATPRPSEPAPHHPDTVASRPRSASNRADAGRPTASSQLPPPPPDADPSAAEPQAVGGPPTVSVPAANPIDLGNFTARGKRVGRDGKPKRRRFGR